MPDHNPFDRLAKDQALFQKVLLYLALEYAPTEERRDPDASLVIDEGFLWRNFPELENHLREQAPEFFSHSMGSRKKSQFQYNSELTQQIRGIAYEHGYRFAGSYQDDKSLRDRIRCYYKTIIQNTRKRLTTMQKRREWLTVIDVIRKVESDPAFARQLGLEGKQQHVNANSGKKRKLLAPKQIMSPVRRKSASRSSSEYRIEREVIQPLPYGTEFILKIARARRAQGNLRSALKVVHEMLMDRYNDAKTASRNVSKMMDEVSVVRHELATIWCAYAQVVLEILPESRAQARSILYQASQCSLVGNHAWIALALSRLSMDPREEVRRGLTRAQGSRNGKDGVGDICDMSIVPALGTAQDDAVTLEDLKASITAVATLPSSLKPPTEGYFFRDRDSAMILCSELNRLTGMNMALPSKTTRALWKGIEVFPFCALAMEVPESDSGSATLNEMSDDSKQVAHSHTSIDSDLHVRISPDALFESVAV